MPPASGMASSWRLAKYIAYTLLLVACLYAGLFARFSELGSRPLAVDEYYFIRSVNLILEQGVPKFSSGGYYTRGLLPQYVTAVSALVFGENGFAYRFPAVLFSLGSVVLCYFYAKGILGRSGAAAVAFMLLVSSWHIEFARFARMYSAFQGVTLLFLIAVHKAFFQGKWHWRYWPHVTVGLATLTHAQGMLLTPFLFIPLLMEKSPKKFPTHSHRLRFCAASVLTTILCLAWGKFDFRNYGVTDALPENYLATTGAMLRLPVFPFWSVSDNPLVNLSLVLGVLIVAAAALLIWKYTTGTIKDTDIILTLLVISTASGTFVLSFVFIGFLLFRYNIHQYRFHPKRSYLLLGVAFMLGVGWMVYALTSRDWIAHTNSGGDGLALALQQTFFGWPDLYSAIIKPWAKELPLLGLLAGGALAYQIATKLRDPLPLLFQNPAFILVYLSICLGVLKSPYTTTRYVFFIYPVILVVMVLSGMEIIQKLMKKMNWYYQELSGSLAALACIGIFALTSDFNPSHIINVSTKSVGFRTHEFESFSRTWYARSDYVSPANFLNRLINSDGSNMIVVVGNPPISYYLNKQHAVYYDRKDERFINISRSRGTLDLWSNNRLLSTDEELKKYTAGTTTVWIVRSSNQERQPFVIEEVWNGRFINSSRVFLSNDNRIEIMMVRLKGDTNSGTDKSTNYL